MAVKYQVIAPKGSIVILGKRLTAEILRYARDDKINVVEKDS